MPGEEGMKVRGNQKDKKGKGSEAPNPLLAVMAQVPKASAKGNTKGASHTHAANMKSASHTLASESKGVGDTQLLSLAKGSKGASHTTFKRLVSRKIPRKLMSLKCEKARGTERVLVILRKVTTFSPSV